MFVTIANKILLSLLLIDGASDSSELFSTLHCLIALLDKYENNECSGVGVAFNKNGKYYDKAKGPNWWEYYFEPLKVGAGDPRKVHNYEKRIYSLTSQFEMKPERKSALFSRYVRIKEEILAKVPDVNGAIGIYYHRSNEAPLQPAVHYSEVAEAVRKMESGANLFVVSSDEKFVKYIQEQFPGKVQTCSENKKGKYAEGERELIQALALSRCSALIRTSNTFSKSISHFNPQILAVDLDKNWQEME